MCKLLSRCNPEFLHRYQHDLCKSFSNDVPVTSARRHILIFDVKQQEDLGGNKSFSGMVIFCFVGKLFWVNYA